MIDLIDKSILQELSKDSRLSMSELGRRVHLSPPAVKERVLQLEEQGIIVQYTTRINEKLLGYNIQCIIEVTIKNNRYNDFKELIQTYSNVDFCYRIAGEACFMVKMNFSSFENAEATIDQLQNLAHTKTNFIFSEVELSKNYINKSIS